MISYGQHSKCAGLLNSYKRSYNIRALFFEKGKETVYGSEREIISFGHRQNDLRCMRRNRRIFQYRFDDHPAALGNFRLCRTGIICIYYCGVYYSKTRINKRLLFCWCAGIIARFGRKSIYINFLPDQLQILD